MKVIYLQTWLCQAFNINLKLIHLKLILNRVPSQKFSKRNNNKKLSFKIDFFITFNLT